MSILNLAEWQSHQPNPSSEKLLSNNEIPINSSETSSTFTQNKRLSTSLQRHRSSSTNLPSSSPTNSQKMGIQLQITISLLAISICFIFCTLPNCISTIMIQAYAHNNYVRQFWQAMNYFSIIPLLITHSVNLIFYYLSSNMFRERFNEYYFKKRT
jgi:magnesium-transporting ATPase (P-type)